MENQHRKIDGYPELAQIAIDDINSVKRMEQEAARLIAKLVVSHGADQRRLALARTYLEMGFMFAVKAIAKPKDPWR